MDMVKPPDGHVIAVRRAPGTASAVLLLGFQGYLEVEGLGELQQARGRDPTPRFESGDGGARDTGALGQGGLAPAKGSPGVADSVAEEGLIRNVGHDHLLNESRTVPSSGVAVSVIDSSHGRHVSVPVGEEGDGHLRGANGGCL